MKNASWHDSGLAALGANEDALELAATYGLEADTADAGSGAMPVRVRIPKRGHHLAYHRYWIDAGQPTRVGFGFVRSPVAMLWSALGALALAGVVLLAWRVGRRRGLGYGTAVLGAGLAAAWYFDVSIALALVVALVVVALRADGVRRALLAAKTAAVESAVAFGQRVAGVWGDKQARFSRRRDQSLLLAWSGELVSVSWLMLRLALLFGVGLWLVTVSLALVDLLQRPL